MVSSDSIKMDSTTAETTVCVVGAGVCGIVSVKVCLEAGFKVTCYNKSPNYGGLWNYNEDRELKFGPSVMRTTILNTSKEMSAFSDFPPPAHLPNFMKHNLYMDYIRSYAEHFNVLPHIYLDHEVICGEPKYDADKDQFKWLITVKNLKDNTQFTNEFDKLMIAIGHHNVPFIPSFMDQHNFKGLIVHSGNVKDILNDERFIDKRVVVVGLGNSACDAACDLAMVASRCYVSSHRGTWLIGRITPSEKVLFDFEDRRKVMNYRAKLFPKSLVDKMIMNKAKSRINHDFLGLTPRHKPSEHVPTINDLFAYRVLTGGIVLKGPITRFTTDGVVFAGEEDQVYKADCVILATGYTASASFLNEFELGLKSSENDEFELFMNIFAPKFTIPGIDHTPLSAVKSLAFIGLVHPSGSMTVVSELQARYAALVFGNKLKLPYIEEMIKHLENTRKRRSKAIRSHSRDQLLGTWIAVCEEIAGRIGVKPDMRHLFFTDLKLWKTLAFGPSVSYQYRLKGPDSWEKARETIMTVQDRVEKGLNEGKNHILRQVHQKSLKDFLAKNSK